MPHGTKCEDGASRLLLFNQEGAVNFLTDTSFDAEGLHGITVWGFVFDLHPHRGEHVDLLDITERLLLDGPLAVLLSRGDSDPAGCLRNYLQHLVRSTIGQLVDDVVVLRLVHVTEEIR